MKPRRSGEHAGEPSGEKTAETVLHRTFGRHGDGRCAYFSHLSTTA